MKYRKKPVVIEAIQYNGENYDELYKFTEGNINRLDSDDIRLLISTLEGDFIVSKNDYVIKGIKGEFYSCKPDIFMDTYETYEE